MKKTHLLIGLFICLCTQAQIANFPYQLDYWKPVGITIKNAFAVNTNEYMLIGSVENYSPETYPCKLPQKKYSLKREKLLILN